MNKEDFSKAEENPIKEEQQKTKEQIFEELNSLKKNQLIEISQALTEENEAMKAENEKMLAELEEQKAKYKRAEKIVAQANDVSTLYQRLQVDFDNYRKRNQEFSVKAKEDAEIALGQKIVPVLDNFLRAIASEKLEETNGFVLIARQFEKVLSELSIARIPALGEKFDILLHDAIMTVPAQKEEDDEKIVGVIAEGYCYKDKIIKHAQVVVSKYEPEEIKN